MTKKITHDMTVLHSCKLHFFRSRSNFLLSRISATQLPTGLAVCIQTHLSFWY